MGKGLKVPGRISRFDYAELHKETLRTPTKEERRVIWDRLAKKYLKSKGYLYAQKFTWLWSLGEGKETGTVEAVNKSEARGLIKKALGIPKKKRLPLGIVIRKVVLV